MTEFSENFHCINYIWPIGYQIKRTWYNYENPLEMITYICEISKSGNGSNTMPLFNVKIHMFSISYLFSFLGNLPNVTPKKSNSKFTYCLLEIFC